MTGTMFAMQVHHLALRTKKLAAVVRFYRDVLGLAIAREQRTARGAIRSVWLRKGRGVIVMVEAANRSEPAIPRATLECVAFGLRPADLAKVRERLVRRKIRIEAETSFTCYIRDPDGRRVAITSYPVRRCATFSA